MNSDQIQIAQPIGNNCESTVDPLMGSGRDQSHLDVMVPEPGAMEVFIAWEKLRLLYNAILACLTIWFLNPFGALLVTPMLAFDILLANLGFCAGPVAEGYLRLLGLPRKPVRWVIFGIGTAIAVIQAIPVLEEWSRRLDR